jgi:two-component system, NtrC family, response regulator
MDRVLIIDDDDSFREVMVYLLREDGIDADAAIDGKQGLAAFDPARHAVVVTDLKMPGLDGLEVLRVIKEKSATTVVLVITAFGTIDKAVEAMKAGAFDFIPKPCTRDHFKLAVHKAIEHRRLATRVTELEHVVKTGGRELVFVSEAMAQAVKLADRVAASDATVLVTGESGTGKELFARRIHRRSPRIDGPFVAVNCGAIPNELIESELFGHAKGAFTGAVKDRKGKFELAAGGTLFLDEIAELPAAQQSKLLRVLAERIIDVVGKEKPVEVDVRIVTATNRDLPAEIAAGRFREDLFYRLNVVQVELAPLRTRPEDIAPLAEHFLARFAPDRPLRLTPAALDRLRAYAWPGNIRELENLCQRIALLADEEEIDTEALPPWKPATETASPAATVGGITLPAEGLSLVDLERDVIVEALRQNDFNQARTARFLRVPRHILTYRIEKHGIEMPSR